MQLFVVDDNNDEIEKIKELLSKWIWDNDEAIEAAYYNCADISLLEIALKADLLLLDIDLPGMSGIEFAHLVRKQNETVTIAFITSYPSFAIEGYDVTASGFLVKPYAYEQFDKIIRLAISKTKKSTSSKIVLENGSKTELFVIEEIMYVEAQRHHCVIALTNAKKVFPMSLSAIEKFLPSYHFIKCHRSYFVNLSAISALDRNELRLKNDDSIPVSTSYINEVKQKLIEKNIG